MRRLDQLIDKRRVAQHLQAQPVRRHGDLPLRAAAAQRLQHRRFKDHGAQRGGKLQHQYALRIARIEAATQQPLHTQDRPRKCRRQRVLPVGHVRFLRSQFQATLALPV
jgi:hypothetical protein